MLDVILVGNAPAQDFNLPEAYSRYLSQHYDYLRALGVNSIDPQVMTMNVTKDGSPTLPSQVENLFGLDGGF